jgi:hypothetical protein
MDTQPGTIWGREPAMVLALVQALIALVASGALAWNGPRTPGARVPIPRRKSRNGAPVAAGARVSLVPGQE